MHQTTNSIVKTKPYRVDAEDLNVKGMLKDKHLAKAIGEQCVNMFQSILKYKCAECGKVIDRGYNASMNSANDKLA